MEILARTCKMEEMNVQRIFARIFVVFGGLLWVFMAWGAAYRYQGAPISVALGLAGWVALGIAAVFVLGMFYEYIASAVLAAGAVAILITGIFAGWEGGVWATVFFFFVLPMFIAAALYFLAARMQRICTLDE